MKDQIISYLIQVATPICFSIVTGLISVATLRFNKYVKTKTKNEDVVFALERITKTTETIVNTIGQEIVTSLKEKSVDGKLTFSQINSVKNQAIDRIIERVPDAVLKVAEGGVADVTEFIKDKIEQSVLKQKAVSKGIATSVTTYIPLAAQVVNEVQEVVEKTTEEKIDEMVQNLKSIVLNR